MLPTNKLNIPAKESINRFFNITAKESINTSTNKLLVPLWD